MGLKQEFRDFVASVVSFPQDFLNGFGLPPSESGAIVNEFSAMQTAAYMGCIRVISDAVATLPLNVYERMPDGSEVLAPNHPLFHILHNQPNPEVTSTDHRQAAQSHILLTGNAYMELIWTNGGRLDSMYLRSPFTTFPYRKDGELLYKTADDFGKQRVILNENMLHIKGLGIDALVGLSPVKYYAREVLGVDISAQSYSANYFKNGATLSGYLQAPSGNLTNTQKLETMNSWMQAHGRGNNHTPAVLEKGWEWKTTTVNPQDTQLIQLRQLNRDQIAAIFGVPQHMIGGAEDNSATIEQKALDFLTFTLKPWIHKWEQAINAKLFPTVGRNAGRFFAKFDTSQLEQPDFKTKTAGIQMARYAGLVSAQEGRKELGYQPYTDKQLKSMSPADRLLMPVNMTFVGEDSLTTPPAAKPGQDSVSEGENPAPNDNNSPSDTEKNASNKPVLHAFRMFAAAFSDAFARISARKKPDAKDFERTFMPILSGIVGVFEIPAEPGDMQIKPEMAQACREWIAGLAHRASLGAVDVPAELRRAIEFIRDKVELPAEDEEKELQEP